MTRRAGVFVLLASVLSMCCASGVELDAPEAAPLADVAWVLHDEPEPCGMAFDPAPELLDATLAAAERWSAATGCDVRVEAGGVRIVVLDQVIDNSGKPTRARTTTIWVDGILRTDRIEYRADSIDQAERIVPHEVGHAIGGYGHTLQGVMQSSPALGERIDADSLELVCQTLACAAFLPEL